jgi:hypothetical protein
MPDKSSSGVDIASKDPAHDPLHGVPLLNVMRSELTITDSGSTPNARGPPLPVRLTGSAKQGTD